MKNMDFDFSISFDGEIEYVSPYNDSTSIDCEVILKKLLEKKLIDLGERSEGNVVIEDDIIILDYRVCVNLGEDWDSDEWDDVEETYPVSVLQ